MPMCGVVASNSTACMSRAQISTTRSCTGPAKRKRAACCGMTREQQITDSENSCYNGVVSAGTANSCPYCRGEKLELEKWEYSSYSDWYQFESTVATG